MRPFDDIDRISHWPALDRVANPLRKVVQKGVRPRRLRDALHGVWLGHPLHPALVQLPIGSFVSSAVLDLLPGNERGADTLIGVGLAASVPAALAGATDWSETQQEQQRMGLVHAGANTASLLCYVGSLGLRARGRRGAGVFAGLAGLALATAGATIGGHLSFSQSIGANHAEAVPHIAPDDWTDLGPVTEIPMRQPTQRMTGEVPVVVVRTASNDGPGSIFVLSGQCSHLAAPLADGELVEGRDGETCLQCPWHQSVFRLADGAVVHGPATSPQTVFDTRIVDGHLQAKVQKFP